MNLCDFIEQHHKKIIKEWKDGGFGGWGRDANFVAPLSEANSLVRIS